MLGWPHSEHFGSSYSADSGRSCLVRLQSCLGASFLQGNSVEGHRSLCPWRTDPPLRLPEPSGSSHYVPVLFIAAALLGSEALEGG